MTTGSLGRERKSLCWASQRSPAPPGARVYRGRVESINSDYGETTQYIQVDVEAGGGLSGAPVISRDGFVIGIMVEELFEGTDGGVPRRGFSAAYRFATQARLTLQPPSRRCRFRVGPAQRLGSGRGR